MTTPIPHRISDLRRLPARNTPSAPSPSTTTGKTHRSVSSSRTPACAFSKPTALMSSNRRLSGSIRTLSKIVMPRSSSALRRRSATGLEVEDDVAVFGLEDIAAALECLHDLLVRGRVHPHPQLAEALRSEEVAHEIANEVFELRAQRAREERDPRRQVLGRELLDVDVLEERVRHAPRHRIEDVVVLDERRDRVDVATGFEQIVVQPDREHRERHEDTAEDDAERGQHAPPHRHSAARCR